MHLYLHAKEFRNTASCSHTLQNMPQVQLVDGDEIFHSQCIFLDVQDARAAEVDNTMSLYAADDLPNAVILRTGTIIHQVAQLDIIIRAAVKRVYNRQTIQSI